MGDIISVLSVIATILGFGIKFYFSVKKLEDEQSILKKKVEEFQLNITKINMIEKDISTLKTFEEKSEEKFEKLTEEIKLISTMITRIDTKLEILLPGLNK